MSKKATSASEVILIAITKLSGEYLLGYMRNFSCPENYNLDPIFVIGEYRFKEVVYNKIETSWTADGVTIFSKTPKEIGILPQDNRLIFSDDFILKLVDKKTNKTLALLTGVYTNSSTMTVNANAVITGAISGIAQRLYDRSESPT